MFDYHVKFPLSLVISRKTILRYQLLFRFLLHLKHIEQGLCSMWTEQMTAPWRCARPSTPRVCRLASACVSPASAHARVRAANTCFRNVRGAGAELARTRGEAGKGRHCRPIAARSPGFPGYVLEREYADELKPHPRE